MSKMKRFAEKISVEMGYGGELNSHVLKEANRVLKNHGLERHTIHEDSISIRHPHRDVERIHFDVDLTGVVSD